MLIEEKALKHWIDNFYGYGSWHAKFWFIGYEESGGELPEEVAEKINYFYRVHASAEDGTLCDIRELYRHVARDSSRSRFGGQNPPSRNASAGKAALCSQTDTNTVSTAVPFSMGFGKISSPLFTATETRNFLISLRIRNTLLHWRQNTMRR